MDLRPGTNPLYELRVAIHCWKGLMWAMRFGINVIVVDTRHLNTHSIYFLLIDAMII